LGIPALGKLRQEDCEFKAWRGERERKGEREKGRRGRELTTPILSVGGCCRNLLFGLH
jgi:hypothetical protein